MTTHRPRIAPKCGSQKSHVVLRRRQKHATVLPAALSLHMGLYAHICTSKSAAESPTRAAAAAGEYFGTELTLFADAPPLASFWC